VVGAIVALPLVLPPAVLGFYLLVLMGPQGGIGHFTPALGLLRFTFARLVVSSVSFGAGAFLQVLRERLVIGVWMAMGCTMQIFLCE
jgi:molybdate transport system permease protein